MSTIIQIKRSANTSAPSTLKLVELAYTYGTGTQGNNGDRLFIGEGGVDGNGDANNITVIGGQYFVDQLDHVQGTLTASSALLVDSNKAIDEFFVGNSTTIGGQIKLNEGTDNGTNFIGLKAPNNITTSVTFTLPSADGTNGQILTTDGSGNLSFSNAAASSFTIQDDSSTTDTFNTGETLTFAGGTGLTSAVTDNTVTFNIDSTVATLTGSQTLTNKTLTSPVISTISNTGTITLPTSTDTLVGRDTTDTLTNKTINTASNNITVVEADISDLQSYILADSSDTLQNKTINSDSNTITLDLSEGTLTGTTAEFNSALSDGSFATLAGTETLTNKTLTAPKFADGGFIADSNGNEQIVFNTTASAVNFLDVTNAATGNGITLASAGTDTNIDFVISPKGSGAVSVDSSRITNVTDPSGDQDAATKAYVDSVANGLDVKDSVRYASTANVAGTYDNGAGTITAGSNGAFSIDGQTPSQGDRVLLKDQSSAVQNGLYIVTTVGDGSTAYVLTRTPDADAANEITGGAFVFVEEGSANADNGYVFTHNGTPTLGSTDITVAQFSGAGQISAGDALTKTGNTLDVRVDDSTIEVSGDALRVKADGIGTNQLATDAVTTIKVTDLNVTNAKLANSSISFTDES